MSKQNSFDPAARYHSRRMANFKASCRLEGIEIADSIPGLTIEAVVEKYRKLSEEKASTKCSSEMAESGFRVPLSLLVQIP